MRTIETLKRTGEKIARQITVTRAGLAAGVLLAGATLGCVAGYPDKVFVPNTNLNPATATPKPSEAAGTPTPRPELVSTPTPTRVPKPTSTPTPRPEPTATPRPTATPEATATPEPPKAPTPKPTITKEIVPNPNDFGVIFDANTQNCTVIDRKTGKPIDISNYPVHTIDRPTTGVGNTAIFRTHLPQGQVAIIEGRKVDGRESGVFVTVNAIGGEVNFTNEISDGAITVVKQSDGPVAFCRAVNTAIQNGFDHQHIIIPPEWQFKR